MSVIYLNGRFLDEKHATVSALDRGLLYGDGLFETMRAYDGGIFRLDAHLDRLAKSAKALRIPLATSREEIAAAIARLIRLNVARPPSTGSAPAASAALAASAAYVAHPPPGAAVSSSSPALRQQKDTPEGGCATSAYIRITLTRGIHTGDLGLDTGAARMLIIQAREFRGYPPTLYKRGMKLAVAEAVRPSRSLIGRHKTLNYLENLLARDAARKKKCYESLFLDERGFIAECSASNIFFVRRGVVFTPSLDMNILPGITRAVVVNLCRDLRVTIKEGHWRLAELKRADEVFLTNSLMEIMPANGPPGPVTRRLAKEYKGLTG